MVLDADVQPLLAQYLVNDNVSETPTISSKHKKHCRRKSKGKGKAKEPNVSNSTESTSNHEGLTWDEEVQCTTGEDPYMELYGDLPDVSEWVNPNWSCSNYMHTETNDSNEHDNGTNNESVKVTALIYKVNKNYVFDNDKYAAVLRNLCTQEETESSHSQTHGAGLSQSHCAHRMMIEEVEDESEGTVSSHTESYIGKGKGKSKPKKKSKKHKHLSLGVTLDDLEGPWVVDTWKGYKAQAPKQYKGEVDIDKLDLFIFNYDLFVDDTKLSDAKVVLTVSCFLDDKAATWYMLNVMPNPGEYTMEMVYVGLYKYCFPPNFKEEMHRQYNKKKQGDSSVQDYFAELAKLRQHLHEITNHQHMLRAWDGMAQYIRVGWALKGIQAETTTIDTLCNAALDIEHAHKIKHSIEKSGNNKSHS
ncbi:hypothetical protein FRC11_005314 [Ceratobasidium sp. 423]|nr:hypothetical protein FRC11_005314 [Ceratobasidium sp. 423]